MAPFTITCPRCQGSGRLPRYGGAEGECYKCHGSGRLPEPSLTTSSIRRWVKVAHVLALHSDASGRDVDDALENAYGRASVSGVLGAMRESNLTDKDSSSPSRWRLTPDGFAWQQLYCRECLGREPRHKRNCSQPPPITDLGRRPEDPVSDPGDALSSLIGASLAEEGAEALELLIDIGDGEATVHVPAGDAPRHVSLRMPARDCEIIAVRAVALGEALVQAGRRAQGL